MTDFLTATTWETVELEAAWESLDRSLVQLDTLSQIQLVGRAIGHLVELFVLSSQQVFDELDAIAIEEGPAMTIEQFLPFVRQTMEIDFDRFVEGFARDGDRGPYAPRQAEPNSRASESRSTMEIEDSAADAGGEETTSEPEMGLEKALELAHDEDVEAWTSAISTYFDRLGRCGEAGRTGVQTVSFRSLQQSLNLPWIEVWLGLLLGGFELNQCGSNFYTGEIWVGTRSC